MINFDDGGTIEAAIARLQKMRERVADLTVPLNRVGMRARDEAVMRIREQGGDEPWAPSIWKTGQLGVISGRMRSSLAVETVSANQVTVGTNVMSDGDKPVSYPYYFQFGSGVFAGHTSWTVSPKKGQAISFVVGGGEKYTVKSVTIQGQPPRPFLKITDATKAAAVQIMTDWIFG